MSLDKCLECITFKTAELTDDELDELSVNVGCLYERLHAEMFGRIYGWGKPDFFDQPESWNLMHVKFRETLNLGDRNDG